MKEEKSYSYQNLSLEDIPGEVWKPVVGYIDEYEVSNFGRIKSLERYVAIFKGERIVRERIIKQLVRKLKSYKYLSFNAASEGVDCRLLINRVVALSFIPNFNVLKNVLHKNYDTLNNCVDNLKEGQWQERLLLDYRRKYKIRPISANAKAVDMYTCVDVNPLILQKFNSIREASYSILKKGLSSLSERRTRKHIANAIANNTIEFGYKWRSA